MKLESRKMKRTGFYPAMFIGGMVSGFFPIINMLFRGELYTSRPGDPLTILLSANWQMMGMLNLCMIVVGACVLYHIEYAQRAIYKMESLPYSMMKMFMTKVLLLFMAAVVMVGLEMGALAFCATQWFVAEEGFWKELLLCGGYECVMLIPSIVLMTWISSMSKNVWISLGIGAILIFLLSLFQTNNTDVVWFPFEMAQTYLIREKTDPVVRLIGTAALESMAFVLFEWISYKLVREYR